MIKRILLSFSIFTFHFSILFAQAPRSYTSSEILLQLKKLNTVGSVLYIAAHPDDENTRLIAYLANEKCLRTGYLALTRGDGGQNLIGSEQGVELGIIRTQELLAARRIDGAEQFFTRAYDFGFSKTPKETFEKWNHDSVLADVVWVIRNFRPDIIITRFATDGSGGHGHHTASAILAEEAFDAAADPKRFPEQLKYVDVWQTRRMFYNSAARFFNPNADMSKFSKLDVGGYNALLGKSYGEIAAESRSMHRSQGFGSAKQRGESFEYFKPIKGDTANLKDIFDGIDFSLKSKMIFDEKLLKKIGQNNDVIKNEKKLFDRIVNEDFKFDYKNPREICSFIQTYYSFFDNSLYLKDEKLRKYKLDFLDNCFRNSFGIYFESIADNYYASAGSELKISNFIINRLFGIGIRKLSILNFSLDTILNVDANKLTILTNSIKINSNSISQPYWLEKPIKNNLFQVSNQLKIGKDFFINNQNASLHWGTYDQEFNTSFPIQYKWVDPSRGELYRPLVITPPVMINIEQKSIVFADDKQKEIKVTIKAGKDHTKLDLEFSLPTGWKIKPHPAMNVGEPSNTFGIKNLEMDKKGEDLSISLFVTAPSKETEAILKATAIVDGVEYSKGIKEIKYDHIPIQTWFPDAEAKLVKLDIKTKSKHIGYIPGAGDEVQQCLQQLGYEVTTLTDEKLNKENLSQFDAIVTGVRAYNTNEKLSNFKQKLMDYVSDGGNLIVQYNTNNFISQLNGNIGPYPFKVTRDRVTDENAKVNFELPNHPVLNTPNKITDKDFEGWIQERCIYTASDSTGKYEMPLSMADENEKPNKGSLIISKYGKGNFIYTGLVFFRELPAGVPGAYRLFVNMIELGK